MFDRLSDGLLRAIRPRWLFRARRSVPSVRRGPVTHVIILDGTMSSMEPGEESNAGLIYRLLSDLSGPELSVYYEAGIQWTSWQNTH
jgi:hypothetical protein